MAATTSPKPLETKRGDTKTSLLLNLVRGDNSSPDLSGLVEADIKIHIKNVETGAVTASNISAIVSVTDPAQVRYDPTPTDVLNVVKYEIEVQVTHTDAKLETFPVCDKFFWNIVKDLA